MKRFIPKSPLAVIFMGVAGTGKTTIGRRFADAVGARFFEGDDYHSPENVEKMRRGIPLTDEDRAPWLMALRRIIEDSLANGQVAVVTCSALKASYRTTLKGNDQRVRFVFLTATPQVLEARLLKRQGHFLNPSLLADQLRVLEPPADALTVDSDRKPEEIVEELLKTFGDDRDADA